MSSKKVLPKGTRYTGQQMEQEVRFVALELAVHLPALSCVPEKAGSTAFGALEVGFGRFSSWWLVGR